MSTTITYKDNLLTTVDNSIKILRTAGKYLEGDIVVADITANKSQGNENDPIRFFDYDGTLVASYTEVPESLPEAPTHKGLIAQGWNWTLEDIATQFASSGACDIGQMYITDDGKTRIHITVSDMTKSFWLGLAPNGTLSIDWGDGSENSSMTGTSDTTIKTVQHTYATTGNYIISVEVISGGFAFYSTSGESTRLFSKYESVGNYYNYAYGGCVTAIELGNSARIGTNAFVKLFNMEYITIPSGITAIERYVFNSCYALKSIIIPNTVTSINMQTAQHCHSLKFVIIPNSVTIIDSSAFDSCYVLESITIPDSVISIKNHVFNECYSLKSITIPDSVTSIDGNAFSGCYALESITIPDSVTNIGYSAFNNCYALKSVTIPDSVTKIDSYAFYKCYNMDEYHFLSTTPPNLTDKYVFDRIQSDCKMYVPYSEDHSILEAYKTATNWSTYANYIIEEGE